MAVDPTRFQNYPQAEDVERVLRSADYWPTDPVLQELAQEQADTAAGAAADEWEMRTGWHPFIASGTTTQEVLIDHEAIAGNGIIRLPSGLLSVSAVTLNGVAVSDWENRYILQPLNASTRGKPFTELQDIYGYRGGYGYPTRPGRLAITGVWGYAITCPRDVWIALLRAAAVNVLSMIPNEQSIASISQEGFTKSFDIVGIITQKDLLGEWIKQLDKTAARYVRVVV
jgi:hypothetical protein